MVRDRPTTNFITPAHLCNGEDHSFVVVAFDHCLQRGPRSSPEVIGKCGKWLFKSTLPSCVCRILTLTLSLSLSLPFLPCTESPGRIKISNVTAYDSAINVSWALKQSASFYSIQPLLSITVLEIQLDSNGQQLQLNYSKNNPNEEKYQCLGGLKPSTFYKVCLHPVYTDGLTEIVPVCMDAMTESSNNRDFDSSHCIPPEKMTKLGTAIEQSKGESSRDRPYPFNPSPLSSQD